ncbi:MAG TPA: cytochrome c oxidase accessory protein CcoG [Rubrivivax sp.]
MASEAVSRPDDDAVVSIVSLYQKADKIYPRAVSGWFMRWRWALVFATQLVFYGLPWLQWNGRQAVLFDLAARRFYIFELVLYPQDFIFLTALLVICAYALFLFTAVAGRVWCGFACPQTVYTEIFMWIERKFEGDRVARMKLDAAPWTLEKVGRKVGKQGAWIALSLWTGFTLVGYFTPIKTLWAESFTLSFGPWEWFWVLFYGLATYGNAGWLREQVCKYMCPYARFQSAMFDKDTLIISYDAARGEPRGSRSRKADPKAAGLGSCIDCTLCVQVCPTGIDIRKGLQYECIGCAACIDVCDGVMDKMNYPRGLIRYATQNSMAGGWSPAQMWRRVLRPRVIVMTVILLAVCAALLAAIALRSPFRVDVVRDRGTLARLVEDGRIENGYSLQLMNASEQPQRYRVRVSGLPAAQIVGNVEVDIGPAQSRWLPVTVQITPEAAARTGPGAHAITFEIERHSLAADPVASVTEKSTFVIPR